MSGIAFSREEKAQMVAHLQTYFQNELDQEIGSIGAEMLIDFISGELGGYYYNRGLYDAQAVLMGRLDDITEAIYALEKPTGALGRS